MGTPIIPPEDTNNLCPVCFPVNLSALWEVTLYHDAGLIKTRLDIFALLPFRLQYFSGISDGFCNWVLSNNYIDPLMFPFIGGAGLAWWIGESDKPSAAWFMEQFNIEPNEGSHADQNTNDPDYYFTHIKRLTADGFIKAKVEWP